MIADAQAETSDSGLRLLAQAAHLDWIDYANERAAAETGHCLPWPHGETPLRMLFALAAASMLVMASLSAQAAKSLTDAQVKAAIAKASIASYAGSCPCPFNTDRAGRRCRARSPYSRPGCKSPLCYIDDVTARMVQAYRNVRDQKAEAVPAEQKTP